MPTPISSQDGESDQAFKQDDLLRVRLADVDDAGQIALLHADSWRRYYRGAYSDSFLDGDVVADRRSVWSTRLADPTRSRTVVAEDGGRLIGFVHVMFDHDPQWGSLVDNLHVTYDQHRTGVGTALLAHAARAAVAHATTHGLYLWVLEQNTAAQRFYQACGACHVETATVSPPGADPSRLNGSPRKFRMAWPDATGPSQLDTACASTP
ncbi:GNAT family N-acetyltransferase [Micromonospora sp. FIMYZ51]|uniref:GNAT family N-acetyltransferase n=1 Tax=Micromonospora sp. FIMYZ51 TaxID=3051832 RepID=UPI00311D3C01